MSGVNGRLILPPIAKNGRLLKFGGKFSSAANFLGLNSKKIKKILIQVSIPRGIAHSQFLSAVVETTWKP